MDSKGGHKSSTDLILRTGFAETCVFFTLKASSRGDVLLQMLASRGRERRLKKLFPQHCVGITTPKPSTGASSHMVWPRARTEMLVTPCRQRLRVSEPEAQLRSGEAGYMVGHRSWKRSLPGNEARNKQSQEALGGQRWLLHRSLIFPCRASSFHRYEILPVLAETALALAVSCATVHGPEQSQPRPNSSKSCGTWPTLQQETPCPFIVHLSTLPVSMQVTCGSVERGSPGRWNFALVCALRLPNVGT